MNRSNTIGGSDIAAIMGLSPWKTPMEVYHEKRGKISFNSSSTSNANQDQDKPVLQRGRRAEKYILEEYSDVTCFTLTGEERIISKKYPFLVGHIDTRVIGKNIIVEAKSVNGSPKQWDYNIPIYYKTQIAVYAYLTDCERVDLAALFDRWQFCKFSYFRDHEFEEKVIDAAVKFYEENLVKKVEPELLTIEDVKAQYSNTKPLSKIQANQKIYDCLSNMQKIKEHMKSEESKYEQLQLEVMDYMKENSLLEFEGSNIAAWKEQTRTSFDGVGFKKNNPDIYNEYLKTNTLIGYLNYFKKEY